MSTISHGSEACSATESSSSNGRVPQRIIGVSLPDFLNSVDREIRLGLQQAKGNRLLAMKSGLNRLYTNDLVTARDLKNLERLIEITMDVDRKKSRHDSAASELGAMYQDMLLDPGSSQLAVSLVGVAYSKAQDTGLAVGAIFGGVVGAVVGFAIGGTDGAGIGLVVGMAVGAYIGARLCDDE